MMMRKGNFFRGKPLDTIRFILLGAPLLLTACHSDFGPYAMPAGYAHHGQKHQAPPGPEPMMEKIDNRHVPESIEPAASADDEYMVDSAYEEPVMVHDTQADMMAGPSAHRTGQSSISNTDMVMVASAPDPTLAAFSSGAAYTPPVQGHTVSPQWQAAATDLIGRVTSDFGQPAEAVYIRPSTSPAEMDFEKALRAAMMEKGIDVAPVMGAGPFVLDYTAAPLAASGGRVLLTLTLQVAGKVVSEHNGVYDVMYHMVRQMPVPESPAVPATGGPMAINPAQ